MATTLHSTLARRLIIVLILLARPVGAFTFSDDEESKPRATKSASTAAPVSAACKEQLSREKVLVLVAERGNQGMNADQGRYGMHFQGIDRRLQKHGFRTFSQEEIRKQVAQAEIDAYFRNDPDAALAASQKHGATLILRGVISARRAINPVLQINEVYVNMGFNLVAASGRHLADASASADSYAGGDTLGMSLTLLNEHADSVVNRLVRGYCSQSVPKSKK